MTEATLMPAAPTPAPRTALRRRPRPAVGAKTGRARAATRPPRGKTAAASTPGIVDDLTKMIDQLIVENRRLKRQIDRWESGGTSAVSGVVEKGLKGIQRRLQRATVPAEAPRRRTPRARAGATRRDAPGAHVPTGTGR